MNCKEDCECINNGKCNPENGSCKCTSGWKGIVCHIKNTGKCNCNDKQDCDPKIGICTCKAGYHGEHVRKILNEP